MAEIVVAIFIATYLGMAAEQVARPQARPQRHRTNRRYRIDCRRCGDAYPSGWRTAQLHRTCPGRRPDHPVFHRRRDWLALGPKADPLLVQNY